MQKLLFCLFLLTLTLSAADVTGKWSGSFETADAGGETRTSTALLNLKQAGSQITGTVGPNLDEAQPSFDLVVQRVTLGQGGMPSFQDQLQPQQIADVAEFVSSSAGG